MGVILDSSEAIRIERGGLDLAQYLDQLPGEPRLAAITVSEVAVGALLANTTERRDSRLQLLNDLLAIAPVIPFGEAEARVHAALRVTLRATGESIGAADLLIAAQNVREFGRIGGLVVLTLDGA